MLEAIPKSDAPAMTRALLSQAVALREQRQMTQEYMAGCIGESQGGVSRFELGTQRVLLDTFVAYLETCGMGLAIVPLPDDSNQV
jgi:transcriptional regulator with XRE-family HTH domain